MPSFKFLQNADAVWFWVFWGKSLDVITWLWDSFAYHANKAIILKYLLPS